MIICADEIAETGGAAFGMTALRVTRLVLLSKIDEKVKKKIVLSMCRNTRGGKEKESVLILSKL